MAPAVRPSGAWLPAMPTDAKQNFLRVRSASPAASCMAAAIWLTFGVWMYLDQEDSIAARRLQDATSTEPAFLRASCHRNTYRSGPRAFLTKTYAYVPSPPGGPRSWYAVDDRIAFQSLAACEAEVGLASSKFRRSHVWYDRSSPWKARWDLDEPSSSPILWFFGASAVVMLWPAMASLRRRAGVKASGAAGG